jgi:hypothetical protein
MAKPFAGGDCIYIPRLENSFLIIAVDGALFRNEKPGAYLNTRGAEHEGRGDTSPVAYSAGSHHGYVYAVAHLRDKADGCDFPYMPARLAALGDNGGSSRPLHEL